MESMERVSCSTRPNMNFSPGSCNYGMGRFLPRATPFSDCMQSAGVGMAHGPAGPLGYSPYSAADWNLLYHSHGLSTNSLERQMGGALGHHRASSHYFSMSPNMVTGKDYGSSLHQAVTPTAMGVGVGMHGSHSSHHSPHPAYPSPPLIPPQQRTQYDAASVGYHALCGAGPMSPQGGTSCMSPDIDKKENKPKGKYFNFYFVMFVSSCSVLTYAVQVMYVGASMTGYLNTREATDSNY